MLFRYIKVNDIEYGFHPNLEEITLGEYADIEPYLKNGRSEERRVGKEYKLRWEACP